MLFEMLTGRGAFGAETTSDTVARILERDPDWATVPPTTPAALLRLLGRCLEKDPKRRLRDIGDARTELQDFSGDETFAGARGDAIAPSRVRRFAPWAIAALLFGALLAALIVPRFSSSVIAPQKVLRSAILLPESQQLDRSGGTHPMALSPDGSMLVYSAVQGTGSSFRATRGVLIDRPSRLFEGPFVGAGGEAQFDVTADGRFLMTRGDDAAVGRQIHIVTNWFAELHQ